VEIEEQELDETRWWSRAIFTDHWWNDIHAINCQPTEQECDRAMSSLTEIPWIEVDQKLRGNKAPGCKSQYLETQYWMSTISIQFVACNHWVYEGSFDMINVSVNRVSTTFCFTHLAIKGLHYHILATWMYGSVLLRKSKMTCWLPHPKDECQPSVNDFCSCILENRKRCVATLTPNWTVCPLSSQK